jgi:hypothetical protein
MLPSLLVPLDGATLAEQVIPFGAHVNRTRTAVRAEHGLRSGAELEASSSNRRCQQRESGWPCAVDAPLICRHMAGNDPLRS